MPSVATVLELKKYIDELLKIIVTREDRIGQLVTEKELQLSDIAEALGKVRAYDSAPLALTWPEVLEAIRDLREERDSVIKELQKTLDLLWNQTAPAKDYAELEKHVTELESELRWCKRELADCKGY
jgi:chromosome segregation ATPase